MTIGDRLKEVRKSEELTLEAFGQKIGLGKSAIADFESGRRSPTLQTYMLIEQVFGIRREWLETGEEPRQVNDPLATELKAFAQTLGESKNDQFKRKLLRVMARMTESQWLAIAQVIEKLGEDNETTETTAPTPEQLHRQLDEQIEAEKREPEKSEVS